MRWNGPDRAGAASAATELRWPSGPTPEATAELLRSLELTVTRRLDGVLHGNFQGITPGHGSEPGESRPYTPGDDVRRIDWNVTARTQETHVREQIADHDLTAWLVVDASAAMRFGTVRNDKAQVAMSAAAAIGFLSARNRNRVGAVLVAGPVVHVLPPRAGANQVRAILTALAAAPATDGHGVAELGAALDRVAAIAPRRGFVAVISDFPGEAWAGALGRLAMRHDVLAVTIHDPRELDVPPIGMVTMLDPATGRQFDVRVTPDVQRKFAAAATAQRETRAQLLARAGADTVSIATDADWLGTLAGHVQRRRTQAVRRTAISGAQLAGSSHVSGASHVAGKGSPTAAAPGSGAHR